MINSFHLLFKVGEIQQQLITLNAFTSSRNNNNNNNNDSRNNNNDQPTINVDGVKRFLVGIFCTKADVERRQFMRDSVLSFYKDTKRRESNTYNKDGLTTIICSLNDLLTNKINIQDCKMAYVFVVGGLEEGPKLNLATTEPVTIGNPTKESDVVYLNIQENMNEGKTPTFYRYGSEMVQHFKKQHSTTTTAAAAATTTTFDFVIKMDLDTMLFTPNFFAFADENLPLGEQVYGGRKIRSMKKKDHRWASGAFQILSSDLARAITSHPNTTELYRKHEDVDIAMRVRYFGNQNTTYVWLLDKKHVLLQLGMGRRRKYDFQGIIFGHTEWGKFGKARYTSGPFFKELPTSRKIWRHFLYWYEQGKPVDNLYHLFDMPKQRSNDLLVRRNDYIYSKQDFDSSPIVLQDKRLVFFPIEGNGASTWRQLFRRILGFHDWKNETQQFQGLTYLYDFDQETANEIMTGGNYTRAIIVQDPKTRLLTNYMKKVAMDHKNSFLKSTCCGNRNQLVTTGSDYHLGKCSRMEDPVPLEMFLELINNCDQPYWRPQSRKMEPKYYKYINFVGHYESIGLDAEKLLKRIGAWQFGIGGWGKDGNESIFQTVTNWDFAKAEQFYPQNYTTKMERMTDKLVIYDTDYQETILRLSKTQETK